jgi:hypothetical protein
MCRTSHAPSASASASAKAAQLLRLLTAGELLVPQFLPIPDPRGSLDPPRPPPTALATATPDPEPEPVRWFQDEFLYREALHYCAELLTRFNALRPANQLEQLADKAMGVFARAKQAFSEARAPSPPSPAADHGRRS